MPRIFGLNSLAVLAASVAFFVVGFLWYGVIFMDAWMAGHGLTADDAGPAVWMIGGFVMTVLQVVGIGLVLQWRGVSGLVPALKTAGILWLVFALPFVHYAYIYLPAHNATLLMIDGSHLLVGWLVSAAILAVMK